MGYDLWVDGEGVDCPFSASGWDAAATWIEKNAPANTPLRRLAEEEKTDEPREAAAMLVSLLRHRRAAPDVKATLRLICQWLLQSKTEVRIWDGIEYDED